MTLQLIISITLRDLEILKANIRKAVEAKEIKFGKGVFKSNQSCELGQFLFEFKFEFSLF